MREIHDEHPRATLHIVAHSEGTVVSCLGLLHALSGTTLRPANAAGDVLLEQPGRLPSWLEKVQGYMTIGSPIDKHILVWPHLFENFDFTSARELFQKRGPIKWRNYYDYGDPVGFQLDTAQAWLARHRECQPFEFTEADDIGFARYLLPGKAHNDYWEDPAVFEHFIQSVVKASADPVAAPKSRPLVRVFSPMFPYLISFLLLVVGTYVFYRAAVAYLHPDIDPLQRYLRFNVLGLSEVAAISPPRMALHALAIACLLAGVTLFSRLPRLATGWRWFLWGALAFVLGCLPYYLVEENSRREIGQIFLGFGEAWATRGVFVLAAAVALISLVVLMP
ncbi:MAG: hypothetical protein ACREP1_14560, partial [Rhodanobacteraceae bacterium]